jgi:hypothetical protein
MITVLSRADPARRCMPVGEWSTTDQRFWAEAQQPGDFLEEGGRAAAWSPLTRKTVESGYGRYLTWRAATEPLDLDGSITSYLQPGLAAAYARHLLTLNAPVTVIGRLTALDMLARAMTTHGDWGFLRRLQVWVRWHATGGDGYGRKLTRLRHSRELLDLGLELIRKAEKARAGRRSRHWPIILRNGLLIGFLTLRPLRLRNLVDLRLGEHLTRGKDDRWWILIPAAVVKNRCPIRMPFPEQLVAALQLYLEEGRPLLAARASRRRSPRVELFGSTTRGSHWATRESTTPSCGGRALPSVSRSTHICFAMRPRPRWHWRIRPTCAWRPRFSVIVAFTTERHYRMSRSVEAARAHHAMLAKRRRTGGD